MNLSEAWESVNMDEVIDKMTAYAASRLKSVGFKNFQGREPVDFVGDVLIKVVEAERDWSKANCSFTEFLFGCLRSDIYNFFQGQIPEHLDTFPEAPTDISAEITAEKRLLASRLLQQEGADDDELTVFEYWMDGIKKPSEIASDLGVDVKLIYTIIKRLERRLPKVRANANMYI